MSFFKTRRWFGSVLQLLILSGVLVLPSLSLADPTLSSLNLFRMMQEVGVSLAKVESTNVDPFNQQTSQLKKNSDTTELRATHNNDEVILKGTPDMITLQFQYELSRVFSISPFSYEGKRFTVRSMAINSRFVALGLDSGQIKLLRRKGRGIDRDFNIRPFAPSQDPILYLHIDDRNNVVAVDAAGIAWFWEIFGEAGYQMEGDGPLQRSYSQCQLLPNVELTVDPENRNIQSRKLIYDSIQITTDLNGNIKVVGSLPDHKEVVVPGNGNTSTLETKETEPALPVATSPTLSQQLEELRAQLRSSESKHSDDAARIEQLEKHALNLETQVQSSQKQALDLETQIQQTRQNLEQVQNDNKGIASTLLNSQQAYSEQTDALLEVETELRGAVNALTLTEQAIALHQRQRNLGAESVMGFISPLLPLSSGVFNGAGMLH